MSNKNIPQSNEGLFFFKSTTISATFSRNDLEPMYPNKANQINVMNIQYMYKLNIQNTVYEFPSSPGKSRLIMVFKKKS